MKLGANECIILTGLNLDFVLGRPVRPNVTTQSTKMYISISMRSILRQRENKGISKVHSSSSCSPALPCNIVNSVCNPKSNLSKAKHVSVKAM